MRRSSGRARNSLIQPILPAIAHDLVRQPGDALLVKMLVGVMGAAMVIGAALTGFLATPSRQPLGFPSDPNEIARECLENIENGPVLYPAYLQKRMEVFAALSRRDAGIAMNHLL